MQRLLQFLTTDRWRIAFAPGAKYPKQPKKQIHPEHDSIVLFSGGLDSFAGALDLVEQGHCPFAVSQSVRGDAVKQRSLSGVVGGNIGHLQLNHNTDVPSPENPPTQRGRSVAFFAHGILAATTLQRYANGDIIPLFVCENGFISINPPLTGLRLGSLIPGPAIQWCSRSCSRSSMPRAFASASRTRTRTGRRGRCSLGHSVNRI